MPSQRQKRGARERADLNEYCYSYDMGMCNDAMYCDIPEDAKYGRGTCQFTWWFIGMLVFIAGGTVFICFSACFVCFQCQDCCCPGSDPYGITTPLTTTTSPATDDETKKHETTINTSPATDDETKNKKQE